MSMHCHHHSASEIDYISANDSNKYPSFARNVAVRASTGTLKQPRLPGSEKFRFSRNFDSPNADGIIIPTTLSGRKARGNSCNSTVMPLSTCSHSKRKPILPISKNTSRVLNNTNAELSADTVELISNDTSNLTKICKKYLVGSTGTVEEENSDRWSRSSSDSIEQNGHSPKSITDVFLPNSPKLPEMNNNQMHFASIQTNRLRARPNRFFSASPTRSMASSEEDVWVLRSDM